MEDATQLNKCKGIAPSTAYLMFVPIMNGKAKDEDRRELIKSIASLEKKA